MKCLPAGVGWCISSSTNTGNFGSVARELTQSENTFMLDHNMLTKNLKCARRGAAGGPSGMTAEHLKPLDNFRDTEVFLIRGTSGTGQDSQRCAGNSPHGTHDGAAESKWRSSWDCGRRHGQTLGHKNDCSADPRSCVEGDISISMRVVNAGRH